MAHRPAGPLDGQIRALVAEFLQRYDRGAAGALGGKISRSGVWVRRFARGKRSATIDDSVHILLALREVPYWIGEEADRLWQVLETACGFDERVH
jgi:hypothetical protein